jgi:hypothetical protein
MNALQSGLPGPTHAPGEDPEMLRRVVEQGKRFYDKGTSYAQWWEAMIRENGTFVRPYLREAWAHITGGSPPDPEPIKPSLPPGDWGIRIQPALRRFDWKTFAAGAVCSLVACLATCIFLGLATSILSTRQNRFTLIHATGNRVYKMDTHTGQTWLLDQDQEWPLRTSPQHYPN